MTASPTPTRSRQSSATMALATSPQPGRRPTSTASTKTSSKRTVNAGCPPITGNGSTLTPVADVSTATTPESRATRRSRRRRRRRRRSRRLRSHAKPTRTASRASKQRIAFRSASPEVSRRAASPRPHAEPVDGQRRVHGAVNDPGAQRPSRLDAEDPTSVEAAVDRKAEHARVGQRLPLRVRLRAPRPARCGTSRRDRVRPDPGVTRIPSPPVRRHVVAALGDDVAQHFVGAAAEAHQR